jgi:hypothetical protein
LQGTLALVGPAVALVGPAVDSEREHTFCSFPRTVCTAGVR